MKKFETTCQIHSQNLDPSTSRGKPSKTEEIQDRPRDCVIAEARVLRATGR